MSRRKFETFPNLTLRPEKPAKGNGGAQKHARWALVLPLDRELIRQLAVVNMLDARSRRVTNRLKLAARSPQLLHLCHTTFVGTSMS